MIKGIVSGVEKDIVRIPMIGDGPATVTGTDSVTFETDATSVIGYTIKGNLQQSGTPSPLSPIYPSECGDRTINLYNDTSIVTFPNIGVRYGMQFTPGTYSIRNDTNNIVYSYTSDGIGRFEVCNPHSTATVKLNQGSTGTSSGFWMPYNDASLGGVTIVSGNTPPNHYEPYGYKIPITCGGSTSTIYLQEPIRKIGDYADVAGLSIGGANRWIKKLVFDGTEDWSNQIVHTTPSVSIVKPAYLPTKTLLILSSDFMAIEDAQSKPFAVGKMYVGTNYINFNYDGTNNLDTWKSHLAERYASGNPICIWYVLETLETETATIPTITTTKGQNTFSIGTTLPPSQTTVTYLGIKNTYKEGWEIRDQQDRLIWGKNNTLTGVSSISFRGYGIPLKSIKIVGNTQQSGTPAPDAPIMPEFVGEKTENLYNSSETSWELGILDDNGNPTGATTSHYTKNFTAVEPETAYYLSGTIYIGQAGHRIYYYGANKNWISRSPLLGYNDGNFTTPANCKYVRIQVIVDLESTSDWMLNLGSTALPYEPYGYKLPITCTGQTTPIYLGQTQSTRRIKKLVLTGDETWTLQKSGTASAYFSATDVADRAVQMQLICTHYQAGEVYSSNTGTGILVLANGGVRIREENAASSDLSAFVAFLQQQYAAGTPVTVWYVLAEPQVAIVNEPLCKIGTYADELITVPGITPQTGTNTLTVDTTLSPSSISITGHIKSYTVYVMTYIDYTDMTKSYTIGDVNKVNAFTQRRRCNMLDDGTITAFYGDPTFIEDGSNGQVMVYQPKFYYKVEPVLLDGIKIRKCKYYISDYQLPGYKIHPAFIDRTDPNNLKEFPFVCIGAYEGCLQNGDTYITDDSASSTSYKLSSIAFTDTATNGVKPSSGFISPFGTIGNYETTASNRGTGWHIENIWIASMNQLMFVIEMCNPNSQTALGSGVTNIPDTPNTANNASLVGSTSSLGNGSGRATTTYSNYNGTTTAQTAADKTAVSYRGMENPFGNIWKWVDGMTIKNTSATAHTPYICKSFAYTRNSTLTNYDMVNVTIPGNGYVTAFGYDPNFDWLFISAETNSSNTGSIRDYLYTMNSGYTCALLGGRWTYGAGAGLFCWSLNAGSDNRDRAISARICYLPQ